MAYTTTTTTTNTTGKISTIGHIIGIAAIIMLPVSIFFIVVYWNLLKEK